MVYILAGMASRSCLESGWHACGRCFMFLLQTVSDSLMSSDSALGSHEDYTSVVPWYSWSGCSIVRTRTSVRQQRPRIKLKGKDFGCRREFGATRTMEDYGLCRDSWISQRQTTNSPVCLVSSVGCLLMFLFVFVFVC